MRSTRSKVVSKERCPICDKEGRDTAGNNLAVYDDGHQFCYAGHGLIKNNKNEDFLLSDAFSYEYLPLRGITRDTFKFYDVKTKIDSEGKPVSLGFRYPNGSYQVRMLDKKEFYTTGDIAKGGLFGRDKFSAGSSRYITITEGGLDALSLAQALAGDPGSLGRNPVVSVQSSAVAARDCALDRSFLNSYERLYLCLDNDEAGRKATRDVARLFDYNKVFVVPLSEYKDANDYVIAGKSDELKRIWWNTKPYNPEWIISDLDTFGKILSTAPERGVPYPFPTLTEMTYGIRKGESVLITAQEGIGKTELMHAIEHKLLKETDDAIGAIYLEEPKRRHLQSLAGIELQRPVHLPDSGCSTDQVILAVQELVSRDGRLHVYSHFGSNDPDVLLDTIRFLVSARSCNYILLDHVSMVVSGLAGEDERKALDYLVTRLEMMVKELDFALILVSHVNDEGKTRGSRMISKIADIRIDAYRDIVNANADIRNTLSLVISKSREIGKTGPAGSYLYDQYTRSYQEVSNVPQYPPTQANDNQVQGNDRRVAA